MYPYISPEKVEEFRRRWPDADSFLLRASLEGELRYMERECNRNPESVYRKRRDELREWANRERERERERRFVCELCDTEYDAPGRDGCEDPNECAKMCYAGDLTSEG
jgi:hypothetical protein